MDSDALWQTAVGLVRSGRRAQAVRVLGRALRQDLETPERHLAFLAAALRGADPLSQTRGFSQWVGMVGTTPEAAVEAFVRRFAATRTPGGTFDHAVQLLALGLLMSGRTRLSVETRTLATWPAIASAPEHQNAIIRRYAAMAATYETSGNAGRTPRFAEFLGRTLAGAYGSVLDLCCGLGELAPALRPLATRLTGVDFSPEMLRRIPGATYDAIYHAEALAFLETPGSAFDLIVLANVMPYFPDAGRVLERVAGLLAPGGRVALVIDVCSDPYDRRSTGDGVRDQLPDYCHSVNAITRSAAACGLAVQHSEIGNYRERPGAYFILGNGTPTPRPPS